MREFGGGGERGPGIFGGKRADARASGTQFDGGGRFCGEGRARYRDLQYIDYRMREKEKAERYGLRKGNALCGCILVDGETLYAINRPNGGLAEGDVGHNEVVA